MNLFYKVTTCDETRCIVSVYINDELTGEITFRPFNYLLFATGQCIARDNINRINPQLYNVSFDNTLYDTYIKTLTD